MLTTMLNPLTKLSRLLKPNRRWTQVSLRSLFVLMTVLCIILGTVIVPGERQRRAVAAIERLGGSVFYAGDDTWPQMCALLQRFVPRDYYDHIDEVQLADLRGGPTDAAIFYLHALSGLRSLRDRRGAFAVGRVEANGCALR